MSILLIEQKVVMATAPSFNEYESPLFPNYGDSYPDVNEYSCTNTQDYHGSDKNCFEYSNHEGLESNGPDNCNWVETKYGKNIGI